MILGTKGRYAVMAMVCLALRGNERASGRAESGASRNQYKAVSLATVAEDQDMPLAYLEQIFNQLRKKGLVKSVRGPGGGYLLAHSAEDIRVADIVQAVGESIKMTRCNGQAKEGCLMSKSRCLTHDLWEGLGNQIYSYLHAISLKDVCERKVKSKSLPFAAFEHTDSASVH